MGRIGEIPVSASKEKIVWFMNSFQCRELDQIDGEPIEFEWIIFPGFTTLQILSEVQNMMTEIQCELEQFPGTIIFMPTYNDIVWREEGNNEMCIANSLSAAEYARRFDARTDIGHFLSLDQKRNGSELARRSRMENGIASLRTWFSTSVKVGIPYSVDPMLWNEELCEAKEKENCPNISVVTTTQPKRFFAIGPDNLWLFVKVQGNLLLRTIRRPWWRQQNCRQRAKRLEPVSLCKETCRTITNENSEIFQIIFNWPNCTDVGVTKTVAKRKYFTTLDDAERDILGGSCREYTLPRDDTLTKWKDGSLGTRRSVQLWR